MDSLQRIRRAVETPAPYREARYAIVDALTQGTGQDALLRLLAEIRQRLAEHRASPPDRRVEAIQRLERDVRTLAQCIEKTCTRAQGSDVLIGARDLAVQLVSCLHEAPLAVKLLCHVRKSGAARGGQDDEEGVFFGSCLAQIKYLAGVILQVSSAMYEGRACEDLQGIVATVRRDGYSRNQMIKAMLVIHNEVVERGDGDDSEEMEIITGFLDAVCGLCHPDYCLWPSDTE